MQKRRFSGHENHLVRVPRDKSGYSADAGMPLSPWFDYEATGESQQTNADTDKLLNAKFGRQLAGGLGNRSILTRPVVSVCRWQYVNEKVI
jgi:hypothetical protein